MYSEKFAACISLLGIFWPILGIFFNVLINLKHSFDIFYKFLDITVMVTKLKKCIGLSSALDIFGCFSPFCTVLLKYMEPSNIFICIFVHPSFSKYMVTAAVTAEVEHTVMSFLLYVYVYLYANFFKVAVMS